MNHWDEMKEKLSLIVLNVYEKNSELSKSQFLEIIIIMINSIFTCGFTEKKERMRKERR